MIEAMRELARLELNRRFDETGQGFATLRRTRGDQIAPLLVEASGKVNRAYLLQVDPEAPGRVRMWAEELDDAKRGRLPFNKPSGAQSGAVGPVIKRTWKPKGDPPFGPTLRVQNTTLKDFLAHAGGGSEWGDYFLEVLEVLSDSTSLIFQDATTSVGEDREDPHVLAAAIRLIPETRETVFVSVVDRQGRWPGDRCEYQAYLADALAEIKYVTIGAPRVADRTCPLCGASPVVLYPNALKGAGLNFGNVDRAGAFPDLDTSQAWKAFGLCLDCADLLYVFKNHLLGSFLGRVAGDKALWVPDLHGLEDEKIRFLDDFDNYIKHLEGGKIQSLEKDLMEFFAVQDDAHVVLHALWATFGQLVEQVSGTLTDVLPSRLQALSSFNREANRWRHHLAPAAPLEDACFDLSLSMLGPMFKRPGGRRAAQVNSSRRLAELRRQLAGALYHGVPLGPASRALDEEWLTTARWYLDEILSSGNAWGVLHEGVSEKKGQQVRYWTLAGWMRHLARFFYYLHITGVVPMENTEALFKPGFDRLEPYFAPGSGLDSPEKSFAFLLGILYGKLIQVQAGRGVNVASNALTWLKRLNLTGADLPSLYTRIREKLLAYGVEGNAGVRAVVHDLGRLGVQLGDAIDLSPTATCYFLLLGQSVATDVLPSKQSQENKES